MNSLILTAGKGTRFQPYTNTLAKPAIEFLTLPMMMYSRYYAESLNSKSIVCNLHYIPETIKAVNEKFNPSDISFLYSDEVSELLDSGGGVKKAIGQYFNNQKTVFVSNGDNICFIPPDSFKKAFKAHSESNNDLSIIVGRHAKAGKTLSALYADQDLNLKDKGLNRPNELDAYHYLGMMFINPKILSNMPDGAFSLFDDGLLPNLKKLKIKLYVMDSYLWYETGNPQDFLIATQQCLNHIEQQTEYGLLIKNIIKKYRTDVDFNFENNQQVISCTQRLTNTTVGGFCVIGDHCSISESHLTNCVIQSGAIVNKKNLNKTFFK